MKVALVYDRLNKWGGAERVLLALHELFPDAPLFTSVYNSKKASWASVFKVRTSFLQHFPFAVSSHELYPLCMPLAFESFTFDEFDLVISVSSEAAKGIVTKPHTLHICYLLTPTRYLWSGYNEYFHNSFFRSLATPGVNYLKKWDRVASNRPDAIIAISEEVKKRTQKYYMRNVDVIYPPVSLGKRRKIVSAKREAYLLVVSRLVPYKRIDLAIEACNELGINLKIIGIGSEEKKLRSISGPTIEFLGNLTDDKLIEYYIGCIGLLFPGTEDFGITVLEAQKFGKPVLAFKDGGAKETILDGRTGMFFYPQTTEMLREKLPIFMKHKFSSSAAEKQANRFRKEIFKKAISEKIAKILNSGIK